MEVKPMKKGATLLLVFSLFLAPTVILAAEKLEVCGAEKENTLGPYGEYVYQITVPAGIHLMVEMDTAEYNSDLYIKYGGIPDQDCGTDDDCDESAYDSAVEIENTQAGFYYVLVDSDAPWAMDYTIYAYDASCPKRSVAPCGVTKAASMNSYGQDIWQVEVPAAIHLIVDVHTAEYNSDLYIKYGGIPDQDCGTDDDCDESGYDSAVEIENTQAGFYYVLVDSDAPWAMDYTIGAFGSHCSGLDVDVILNQSEYRPGDTLIIQAHIINNDPIRYSVEVKTWVQDPNGKLLPLNGKFSALFEPCLQVNIVPNSDSTHTIKSYLFKGTETPGKYIVELKLIDPLSANYYTRDVDSFSFIRE
jgi:hypothetical protein